MTNEFNPNFNGRVFFENTYPEYSLYHNDNQKQTQSIDKTFGNIQQSTPLNQAFFDIKNLNRIHNGIIEKVRLLKNYNIGRQDDLQVQIIMRSIFLSYSKNSGDINQQISELNQLVVDEAVSKILPEIEQYLFYLKDISKPRTIMSNPVHISSRTQLGGFDMFN